MEANYSSFVQNTVFFYDEAINGDKYFIVYFLMFTCAIGKRGCRKNSEDLEKHLSSLNFLHFKNKLSCKT